MNDNIDDNARNAQTETTVNNGFIVDALRASLSKPGKYVLDCRTMNENDWQQIYPPNVSELASLPGSGLPFWHYEWNYCVACHNTLRNCRANPYGFFGSLFNRTPKTLLHNGRPVAPRESEEANLADKLDAEHKVRLSETPKTRAAAHTYQPTIPSDLEAVIADEYRARETIRRISERHLIAAAAVRDYLAGIGILRKPGDHLKRRVSPDVPDPSETNTSPQRLPAPMATDSHQADTPVDQIAAAVETQGNGGLVTSAKATTRSVEELSATSKAHGVGKHTSKTPAETKTSQTASDTESKESILSKPSANKRKSEVLMPSLFDQAF